MRMTVVTEQVMLHNTYVCVCEREKVVVVVVVVVVVKRMVLPFYASILPMLDVLHCPTLSFQHEMGLTAST